jgi:hypothetical protein
MSTKRKRERPKPPPAQVGQEYMRRVLKHRRERPSAVEVLSHGIGEDPPFFGQNDEPFAQLLKQEFGFTQTKGGFLANLPPAEFSEALRNAAPGAITEYQRLIPIETEALRALFHTLDPAVTLAWLSHRHNFRPWGTFYEPQDEYLGPCIIIAAQLLLEHPQSPQPRRFPEVEELYDLLRHLLKLRDIGIIIEMARNTIQEPPGWLLASAYCLMSPVAMMRVVEQQLRKDWRSLPPQAMTVSVSEPYAVILLGRDLELADFWERSSSLQLLDTVQWIWIIRVSIGQSELLWVMPVEQLAAEGPNPLVT